MSFDWLRLAALHYVVSDGHWSVVGSNELFNTGPLDTTILWHNAPNISKSESTCLMKLREWAFRGEE